MSMSGWLMWKLKDKIDVDFMNLFDVAQLPAITTHLAPFHLVASEDAAILQATVGIAF